MNRELFTQPFFRNFFQKRGFRIFWGCSLAYLLTWLIFNFGPIRSLEWKILDLWIHQKEGKRPEDRIVVVGIDDVTVQNFSWPIHSDIYAEALAWLRASGAKVIALDILFSSDHSLNPSDNDAFIQQIAIPPKPVLIYSPLGHSRFYRPIPQDITPLPLNKTQALGQGQIEHLNILSASLPYQEILSTEPVLAHHNVMQATEDGLLRGVNLVQSYSNYIYPTLSLVCAAQWSDKDYFYQKESHSFFLGNRSWPVKPLGSYYLDYGYQIKVYSFMDVLDDLSRPDSLGKVRSRDRFKDKIVFIGTTDRLLGDNAMTPLSKQYKGETPKVLLHALATAALLDGVDIRAPNRAETLLIMLACAFTLCLLFIGRSVKNAFISALFLVFMLVLAQYFFFQGHILLHIAEPFVFIVLASLFAALILYREREQDRAFFYESFKAYLSQELIDQMFKNKIRPKLGGEAGIRTAFFTDIVGFSTFSEQIGSPERLVELLNEYLSAMTDILMQHQGTLDKYEGDAIIAFFGAPLPMPNHALAACETALHMQEKLSELRNKWKAQDQTWPEIVCNMRMRIGINTGDMVTGNMGSPMRMNYTMMGDAVNLAARLEGVARFYGVGILVSQKTRDEAGEQIIFRMLDRVRVVGKMEWVEIYEPLTVRASLTPKQLELKVQFEEALKLYFAQNWALALNAFSHSLSFEPLHPKNDKGVKTNPSLVFIERCRECLAQGGNVYPRDWDGVFTATSK